MREVVVALPRRLEFRPCASTLLDQPSTFRTALLSEEHPPVDVRSTANMSDIRIMGRLTSHKSRSGRTTESHGAEMVLEIDSLANDVLLHVLHIVERSEARILVVADDEDDVRRLSRNDFEKAEERQTEDGECREHLCGMPGLSRLTMVYRLGLFCALC